MEGSAACTTAGPRAGRTVGAPREDEVMSELLAKILPLAFAAAVNPTGLLVLIALLATAKRAALFLTIGFCLVFVASGVVVLGLGLRLDARPTVTSAVIDIVAAALVAFLGVRALRKHPAAEDKKKRHRLGAAGGLAAGLALAASDFTSLVPYVVALKDMAVSGLGTTDVATTEAVFLVICLAPMVVPVVLTYAAPQTAERLLGPLRRVLARHGNTIIAVVCFVLAAYLAVKGVRGL